MIMRFTRDQLDEMRRTELAAAYIELQEKHMQAETERDSIVDSYGYLATSLEDLGETVMIVEFVDPEKQTMIVSMPNETYGSTAIGFRVGDRLSVVGRALDELRKQAEIP